MKPIFIDTSFFIALAFKSDDLNKRALAWQQALRGPFVTSEFVLLEIADGICEARVRKYAEAIFNMFGRAAISSSYRQARNGSTADTRFSRSIATRTGASQIASPLKS